MEEQKTSIDVHHYIALLMRRKWLWIISTIVFGIGSITYAIIMPDIYESKCVMIVEESKVLDNLLSRKSGRGLDARSLLQAVTERMLGWKPVIQLVEALELDKDISGNDVGGKEKLYRQILKNTTVNTKGSNLIEVVYHGKNPEINFRLVDGLVSNFMEQSLRESRTEADETVEFIDDDLKRLKNDLDESERQLQQFQEEHFDKLPGTENSQLARLSRAKEELATVKRDIMMVGERIAFLDESIERENKTRTGEVTRIPNPKVNDLSTRINELEIEVNSLRAKYFDEHPMIVKRLKELGSLEKMLQQESESIVSEEKIINNPMYDGIMEQGFSAQLQLKVLRRRQKEIESTIVKLNGSIKAMPALRQELSELKRGYSVNQSLYEQRLVEQSKAVLMKEMSLDSKTNPFNIIEPARISYEPVKALKIKIAGIGVILGFGLGVGVIIGWERIDPRFKTVQEVQDYLNIPALGIIPTIKFDTEIKREVEV